MNVAIGHIRIITVAIFALCSACGTAAPDSQSKAADAELLRTVTGVTDAVSDSVRVDVYLDATVSMSGFTVGGTSNYSKFLEALESSLSNGWKRVDSHYWKFGRTSREIGRPEFLTARSPAFYAERGMNETTSIDQVTGCSAAADSLPRGPRLSVVITDLFQKEGDLNAIVGQIKAKCLSNGVSVGVLAIKSQYDGRVYDARVPEYSYRTVQADTAGYRAFYALLFGQPKQFDVLVQSLEQLPFVSARNLVLISPFVTKQFDIVMSKTRESKDVNMNKAVGPRAFSFALRKGGSGGTLVSDVAVTLHPASPPPRFERAELVAFRLPVAGSGLRAATAASSHDIVLKKIVQQAGKFRVETDVTITDAPGKYDYRFDLRAAPVNGFTAPTFVRDLSSDNPSPTKDANKTLQLEKFILDLRQAASSVHQPVLASWTVSILKR